MPQHSTAISADTLNGYQRARADAAVASRMRGRLVVSGVDRATFLHGLLSNDIAVLEPGRGCYATYLTPQGRMITDLWVYDVGDVIQLAVEPEVAPMLRARLDDLVFAEDVRIEDVSGSVEGVTVIGPQAGECIATALAADGPRFSALPEHGNARVEWQGHSVVVFRVHDFGLPGFELVAERAVAADVRTLLVKRGLASLDQHACEALRIEAGTPRFHVDMDEDTIPLEAGIESQAISMTKGCYVGQEVIVRVLHRGGGRIARKLVGLIVEGDTVPSPGDVVRGEGRDAGRVTSAVFSPLKNQPIAIAMVHRDFIESGTRLDVNGLPAIVR